MSIECTTSANSAVTCLYSTDCAARADRRAALTAELGCRAQLRTARPTGEISGCQCATTISRFSHVNIVSPLVRHVAYRPPVRCPRTAAARVHDLHPFLITGSSGRSRARLSAVRTRTLTRWAYREAGLEIPRLAQEQDIGGAIDPGSLRPGDLAV